MLLGVQAGTRQQNCNGRKPHDFIPFAHGNVNPKPSMLLPFLHKIAASEDLSAGEAQEAMLAILSGSATTPQISAFLMGLRMKGETPDELLGFARAMREKTVRIDACVEPLLDTCGTGGAGSTFNISTVAAFVVAGPAYTWPSTAIARFPRNAAAPIFWNIWGLKCHSLRSEWRRLSAKSGSAFCSLPCFTRL